MDDTSSMDSDSTDPTDLSRLADDAMQREYPERFRSYEEWIAYNKQCDLYDSDRSLLKGAVDLIPDSNS